MSVPFQAVNELSTLTVMKWTCQLTLPLRSNQGHAPVSAELGKCMFEGWRPEGNSPHPAPLNRTNTGNMAERETGEGRVQRYTRLERGALASKTGREKSNPATVHLEFNLHIGKTGPLHMLQKVCCVPNEPREIRVGIAIPVEVVVTGDYESQ